MAMLPGQMAGQMAQMAQAALPEGDVEDFLESVDEVSRLIGGLQAGTISPEYIDGKLARRKAEAAAKPAAAAAPPAPPGVKPGAGAGAAAEDKDEEEEEEAKREKEEAHREEVKKKVKDLIENRDRKAKLRAKYEEYVAGGKSSIRCGTDYTKWDMWCPEDEEDDLINSYTPNNPAFKAMEKDIDERHRKMVEQRQIAERHRVAGNEAFKAGQWAESLRCYQAGCAAERTNMTLHANAAMACLKNACFVQAIEHCDKVLHIAELFHNNPSHPLCAKAYQRRATAYRALGQPDRAAEDLASAVAIEPNDKELGRQLAAAQGEAAEARKQRHVVRAMAKASSTSGAAAAAGAEAAPDVAAGSGGNSGGSGSSGFDIEKLRKIEQLSALIKHGGGAQAATAAAAEAASSDTAPSDQRSGSGGGGGGGGAGPASRGPQLPQRGAKGQAAASAASKPAAAAAGGRWGEVSSACEQLRGLLAGDDSAAVYFRACGGLAAAAAQLVAPEGAGAGASAPASPYSPLAPLAPLLLLLHEACMNDGNLLQLPPLGALPPAVAALASPSPETAAAAASLLASAATVEAVRREVSALLGGGDGAALAGLVRTLGGSKKGAVASPGLQAVCLALLGNCMVDKPTKAAMTALWCGSAAAASGAPGAAAAAAAAISAAAREGGVAATFGALLGDNGGAVVPEVAEKAAVLLGNMCGEPGLRAAVQAHPALLQALLRLTLAADAPSSSSSSPELRSAACTALFNLVHDAPGQAAVLAAPGGLEGLMTLLDSAAPAPAAAAADASASASGQGRRGAPPASTSAPAAAPRITALHARAAGVVSRLAKQPDGAARLLGGGGLRRLVALVEGAAAELEAAAGAGADTSASAKSASPAAAAASLSAFIAAGPGADAFGLLDAAVRALTVLTAPDSQATAQALLDAGGAAALLRVVRLPLPNAPPAQASAPAPASAPAGEAAVLGNAALCLGGPARYPSLLPALAGAGDPVAPLVRVAYEGKGNTASKNAAIALARMAHDPGMLERLRELHGIEIIYQYVKP